MNKYNKNEVKVKILNLLDTLDEGFEHINLLMDDLKMDEAFNLLQNVVEGIFSIEKALQHVMAGEAETDDYPEIIQALHAGLNEALQAYENRNPEDFRSALQEMTIPAQTAWHEQIKTKLNSVSFM